MELQNKYAEVESRNLTAIAFSQEDETLADHAKFVRRGFSDPIPFPISADLKRATTPAYDRVTTYFIDEEGIVQQIFPTLIHARPDWDAVFAEIDAIDAAQATAAPQSASAGK